MMTNERRELLEAALLGLTVEVSKIQKQMQEISAELRGHAGRPKGSQGMSAEGKARIAAAAKKRWREWRKARKAA